MLQWRPVFLSGSLLVPYVLIIHDVADYAAWKAVFDEAAALRKAAGELRYQLLCAADDAKRIVHFSEWQTLDQARCFFESPQLVEIRRRAGVQAPQFLYLQGIEQGEL